MNITWKITALHCYPNSDGRADVVFRASFTVTATEGTHTNSLSESVAIPMSDDAPFIDYQQLTEDDVLVWAQDALGADRCEYFEAVVTEAVQNQINPREVTLPLPWVNTAQQ